MVCCTVLPTATVLLGHRCNAVPMYNAAGGALSRLLLGSVVCASLYVFIVWRESRCLWLPFDVVCPHALMHLHAATAAVSPHWLDNLVSGVVFVYNCQ
jgi:hypothetical protein